MICIKIQMFRPENTSQVPGDLLNSNSFSGTFRFEHLKATKNMSSKDPIFLVPLCMGRSVSVTVTVRHVSRASLSTSALQATTNHQRSAMPSITRLKVCKRNAILNISSNTRLTLVIEVVSQLKMFDCYCLVCFMLSGRAYNQ